MKRGGRVGLVLWGIMIITFLGGLRFGGYIPLWYAIPSIIIMPLCLAGGFAALLVAYGDKAFNTIDRWFDWLED